MPRKTYPYTMLAVLTGLNLLNYIDRNAVIGVQPLVQDEFRINDKQYGLIISAFFFCYMFAAPLVGRLGDRFSRKKIVVFGIVIWSGFTLLTWLVHDYTQLLLALRIVGIVKPATPPSRPRSSPTPFPSSAAD